MQNKANFRKSQMNINKVLRKDYEKKDTWWSGKKQSQTNPNKAKFKKAKMNVTSYITKKYENISNWAIYENEPNTNPILSRRSLWRSRNKPNFKGVRCIVCRLVFSGESNRITHTVLSSVSERFQVLNGQYYMRRAL
ncbi:MAG: hypothetical protein ACYS32_10330 [Planctomycetota bacterium]